jgi:branched-chain amino acid transport system permease protein
MPSWDNFQPFIVTGLALGGVYALSGVGMVVLYRATGVLNLAFGAVGAMGAYIAWSLINQTHVAAGVAYVAAIAFSTVVTLLYGLIFGPALAHREPLVKATATLGLTLLLLGTIGLIWSEQARSLTLPTTNHTYTVGLLLINWTQIIGLALGVIITFGTTAFLRFTKLGTAMRALAGDREITASLGVPVRRVEAAAWFASGLLSGVAGLLLADEVGLDATTLTFLVISSLAAALIARLNSIIVTLIAALVIGLVDALITPILSISEYRDMTPFVLAIVAVLVISRRGDMSSQRVV